MKLVRVCGGAYLNAECVGRLEQSSRLADNGRGCLRKTIVFDFAGAVLLEYESEAWLPCFRKHAEDQHAMERENFRHDEIVLAIREGRDARNWTDEDANCVSACMRRVQLGNACVECMLGPTPEMDGNYAERADRCALTGISREGLGPGDYGEE